MDVTLADPLLDALVVSTTALAASVGYLTWRLKSRPILERQPDATLVPIPAPPPAFLKCNVRHYVFSRTNPETGEPEQRDVFRHPLCENYPSVLLTDEYQAAQVIGGYPGEGWQHVETRGEMHLVKQ